MPLSWNEIHVRAAKFAENWQDATYEKGESQSFYNDFFQVFGRTRRDVAVYEQKVKKLTNTSGFIDLFWPSQLLIEQKSAGRDLAKARQQATDYYLKLKESEKPRYILLSDFQTFELMDLEKGSEHHFTLAELPENIRYFDFIAGYQKIEYKDQDPANIEASRLMGVLHNQLRDSGYEGADLEKFLVRLMFCLFADDTGIFDKDIFWNFVDLRTSDDGSDTGSRLIHLFQVLDTQKTKRQTNLDEDLARFPYVNGALFSDPIRTPSFDSAMRQALLDCCAYDWTKVSPALFGSLFQSVMNTDEQRKGGAHYTSENNILKTINPLFMDELRAEFTKINEDRGTGRQKKLQRFHDKLAALTFFDPACGCGNFLIIAYRELRLLELEVIKALNPEIVLDISLLSKVDVHQFYGIEIEEFPARIAEAAMWLVDHQMNMALSRAFGQHFARLPLDKAAHIHHGNALTTDWQDVIAPQNLSYMLGNPPFRGSKYQSPQQRMELKNVFHGIKGAGVLDYVTAWYFKAAQYIQNTDIKVAFVSTNSIAQGEQTAILWQPLFQQYGVKIHFAHRTFKWTIDEKKAKGMNIAAVYCVIIGFGTVEPEQRLIFDYKTVTAEAEILQANNINAYLVDAADTFILKRGTPICDVPNMGIGNKPIDGGNYLFTEEEKQEFLVKEPQAEPYFKKWIGADEFIKGYHRWCLWLGDCPPHILKQMPESLKRVAAVKQFRTDSKSLPTNKIAQTPTRFHVENMPDDKYIIVSKVSTNRRVYLPAGFQDSSTLSSDLVMVLGDATLYHFGIISSMMHMEWTRYTCGRLENSCRYSNSLVYNNFPWPQVTDTQQANIASKAQAVLDARAQFPESSLADLYDPLTMPPALLNAHQALDKAVDTAYRRAPFKTERERIEFFLNNTKN